MAMVSVENNLSPPKTLQKLSDSLTSMLPLLSVCYYHTLFSFPHLVLSITHFYINNNMCMRNIYIFMLLNLKVMTKF